MQSVVMDNVVIGGRAMGWVVRGDGEMERCGRWSCFGKTTSEEGVGSR